MGDPEYLTTDFVAELECRERDKRDEASALVRVADAIAEVRRSFEGRLRDREKWVARTATTEGSDG